MANFVIRLVQDLGHEADITDEIAGVPIHFNGIYEGREAGHKLQGRMKINRSRWKRGQHQVCRPNTVFQERIKVRTTIKENKVVVMLELIDNVIFKHSMNIFPGRCSSHNPFQPSARNASSMEAGITSTPGIIDGTIKSESNSSRDTFWSMA
jgi:hypothetical protein